MKKPTEFNEGQKHDAGKTRWDLMPWSSVVEVAQVLTDALGEYEANSWQRVPNARARYFAATLRHLIDWWEGDEFDKKSHHHHLSHAACNVLFLRWLDSEGVTE